MDQDHKEELKLRQIHLYSKIISVQIIYPLQQSNDGLEGEFMSGSKVQYSKLNRDITQGFFQKLGKFDKYILLKCMRSMGLI